MKITPCSLRSRLLLTFAAMAVAAGHAFAAEPDPGKAAFGRNQYIEYLAGDLPLVISAPHGGREQPEEIPDRTDGVLQADTNTQELIRAVGDEIHARTGHRAHLIICRLARRKLDCNREVVEAAAGSAVAEQAWKEYHAFIEQACATAIARFGKAFFIDLHGQSHKDQRIELGYLHTVETLALADAELNAPAVVAASSLRLLAARSKQPYAELLRGPRSLGALLEAQGFPATPSPARPVPVVPYFNGGYTVRRHTGGSAPIAGLQIESNLKGIRDSAANREKFARALVSVLDPFLAERWDLQLNARPASPTP